MRFWGTRTDEMCCLLMPEALTQVGWHPEEYVDQAW